LCPIKISRSFSSRTETVHEKPLSGKLFSTKVRNGNLLSTRKALSLFEDVFWIVYAESSIEEENKYFWETGKKHYSVLSDIKSIFRFAAREYTKRSASQSHFNYLSGLYQILAFANTVNWCRYSVKTDKHSETSTLRTCCRLTFNLSLQYENTVFV